MNASVEALRELRWLAGSARCWRCEGSGLVREPLRHYMPTRSSRMIMVECPSCAGTGEPERVA